MKLVGLLGSGVIWLAFTILFINGCEENSTASLGGGEAGGRGAIGVVFINNTPEQAVFTFGAFDNQDQTSQPDFEQFGLTASERPLAGNTTSPIISITCGRVLAIGSPQLFDLISENLPDAEPVESALVEGIQFYRDPSSDMDNDNDDNANMNDNADNGNDNEDAEPVLLGSAPPLEALLGTDFPCGALVIIYLEVDDLGPEAYRINFQIVPAESSR